MRRKVVKVLSVITAAAITISSMPASTLYASGPVAETGSGIEESVEGDWGAEEEFETENDVDLEDSETESNDDAEDNEEAEDNEDLDDSEESLETSEEISDAEEETEDTSEDSEIDIEDETSEDEDMEEESEEANSEDEETEIPEEIIELNEMFPGIPSYKESTNDRNQTALLSEHKEEWSNLVEGTDCFEGQIIFYAKTEEEAEAFAKAYNAQVVDYQYGVGLAELNADSQYEKATVLDALNASVKYEEILPAIWPNYISRFFDEPVETTDLPESKVNSIIGDRYLEKDVMIYQWFHEGIGTRVAWDHGYTGKGVKVGVIDSGFKEGGHEDLQVTDVTISYGGKTEFGNKDYVGHGTHVCGIVGAYKDNGYGGAGVAPEASIYSAKVGGKNSEDTSINTYYALTAVRTLIDKNHVDIINLSIGGYGYLPMFEEAINYAYENGVAVFCSAGNDGSNAYSYPACYEKAVCVGALDRTMSKVAFSNFGPQVRYSAPGSDILSLFIENAVDDSEYIFMSGTSQASPIVAGEAAVILPTIIAKGYEGSKRVDELLKVMDAGCIPVKNPGMGKGYVNLPKALGLKQNYEAPKAPVLTVKPGTYTVESLEVEFENQPDCKIYYSTNGEAVVDKNGRIRSAYINEYTGAFTVGGSASVTVNAVAYNTVTGTVGKVSKGKYVLKPKARKIIIDTYNSVYSLYPGMSTQAVIDIEPSYATNKTVIWSVDPETSDVKVDSKGKITVSKNAESREYKIVAQIKDTDLKANLYIYVKPGENPVKSITGPKTLAVNVSDTWNPIYYRIPNATINYTDGTMVNISRLTWSSSDPRNCGVSDRGTYCEVSCRKPGKYKLTGYDPNGSGKKYVLTVKATQLVDDLYVEDTVLYQGKSRTLQYYVGPENASNKSLNWTVTPANKGVKVSSSGKVTASSKAECGIYTITISAKDGSTISPYSSTVTVVPCTTKPYMKFDKTKIDMFRSGIGREASIYCEGIWEDVVVEQSANSYDLISATYIKEANRIYIYALGNYTGTATVTLKTTDGSNLKKSCKVTVHNPAYNIQVAPAKGYSEFLAYGKSAQLEVKYDESYGKLDAYGKKVKWESTNPQVVSVDQKGKVTAKRYDSIDPVYITATTENGEVGRYYIFVEDLITDIKLSEEVDPEGAYRYRTVYIKTAHNPEWTDLYLNNFEVTTSNPKKCMVGWNYVNSTIYYAAYGGRYKVTLKALDGSKFKRTWTLDFADDFKED